MRDQGRWFGCSNDSTHRAPANVSATNCLFENLDWMITPKDRVGLVGGNGTGKSTLLKVIGGMETLDYGSLTIAKGRVGRVSSSGRTDAFGPHASSRNAWLFSRICARSKQNWKL